MRYMLMHKFDDKNPAAWSPTPEFIGRMGAFIEEAVKAGVFLAGEGLRPTSAGAAKITVKNGSTTVVDGPFAEAKEVIAGFAILDVRDLAEAVEWSTRFAALFEDTEIEIEVRRVSEFE
ncbi:YciI family protein [Dactylosporangium fulvum]|uniref:YciI family protein n=1 Tax=Dactylosporangium fulvum TaxID=53359 RepID=A0ABY5W749_9ACTN|nr:YciI family protein [Dactylosporangium fulvum]UWP83891.1 YciI family protein [Dactylosporangium fulvum]